MMGYTDNDTLSKKRVAQRSVLTLAARNKKKRKKTIPLILCQNERIAFLRTRVTNSEDLYERVHVKDAKEQLYDENRIE